MANSPLRSSSQSSTSSAQILELLLADQRGITLEDSAGFTCTAGYMATKNGDNANMYLATAGHCFPPGDQVEDLNGTTLGYVSDIRNGANTDADAELINLTFPSLATNQIIAGATSVYRNVTDQAQLFVEGTRVCFSGKSSNAQKCGFNAEESDIDWQTGSTLYGAAIAVNPNFPVPDYALPGDSGSAVYRSLSGSSLRVYGIMDGSAYYNDDQGNVIAGGFYYTFDTHLVNDFNANALTTPVP